MGALSLNMRKHEFPVILFQVGDGTTSVTLLAAEFLKQVKPYVEEGLHPQIIIRAFRTATQLVWESCLTPPGPGHLRISLRMTLPWGVERLGKRSLGVFCILLPTIQ